MRQTSPACSFEKQLHGVVGSMLSPTLTATVRSRPLLSLALFFCLWKSLLLCLVLASPGPGYDTSTSLRYAAEGNLTSQAAVPPRSDSVLHKTARWDAIYFLTVAERGYLFEQEWAWGYGFTRLLSLLSEGLRALGLVRSPLLLLQIGIFQAHIFHFLSVIVLYYLAKRAISSTDASTNPVPLVTATLHIISPAGAFLSAPYAESLFSLLNITGFYLYLGGLSEDGPSRSLWTDLKVVFAGVLFGLATSVRSNGLLSGIVFAYDAALVALALVTDGVNMHLVRRIVTLGIGGCLVGLGTLCPQVVAYREYCLPTPTRSERRPWCDKTLPSIYVWVQDHYWNVGFLRYWTLSNVPLFFIATPMLAILGMSCFWAWQHPTSSAERTNERKISLTVAAQVDKCLQRLCLPQLVLAVAALTTYHVQIITRLSSGYPLWYLWVATLLCKQEASQHARKSWVPGAVVRWMVLYAMIQGGLFASFLPPA